jgi:hypothetical protein
MEIDKDAFGNFFLMIPTAGWKAKNAFHTYRQAQRVIIDLGWPDREEDACLIATEGVKEPCPGRRLHWPVLR